MTNKKTFSFWLLLVVVYVYSFLKIYRNTINFYDTSRGGIWNYLLIFLFLLFLVIFFTKLDRISNSIHLKIASLLCFFFWVNGISSLGQLSEYGAYLLIVYPSFSFVFILTFLSFNTKKDSRVLKMWIVMWIPILFFMLVAFLSFFKSYEYYQSGNKIALNISYYALCFIPFVFLLENRYIKILLLVISSVIVFVSNKRAGIIALAIGFLLFLFIYLLGRNKSITKKIKFFFVFSILFIVGLLSFYFIDKYFSLNIFSRLFNVFNDGGSGRVKIYTEVFDAIKLSSPIELLFGHGVGSISSLNITSAHNDFLNILYELGFVPFLLVSIFYFVLICTLLKMIRYKNPLAPAFGFSVAVSLILSLFSSNFDDQLYSIVLAVFWGISISDFNRSRKESALRNVLVRR